MLDDVCDLKRRGNLASENGNSSPADDALEKSTSSRFVIFSHATTKFAITSRGLREWEAERDALASRFSAILPAKGYSWYWLCRCGVQSAELARLALRCA
jgi:hypothetical protein